MASTSGNRSGRSARRSTLSVPGLRSLTGARAQESRDYYDYNLLAAVILLTCFGLVMLYSTSAYEAEVDMGSDTYYFAKQAVISLGSAVIMLIVSQLDYHKLVAWSEGMYFLSLGLLVLTKFIGRTVNGARRWIYVGPISFQPAEIAKLTVILYLAFSINAMGKKQMQRWKADFPLLVIGGLASGFTYIFTDNLSTALIIAGITVVMIFIINRDWKIFMGLFGAFAAVLAFLYAFVFPNISADNESFRLRRILVWLHPEEYADQGGYQVTQALYALGSGGFFGKGLGNSAQKLGALPEAQNDMIFSITCEELGVFGAAIVIGLFVFLLYRLFFIAQNAPDLTGSLVASGIFTHIALQVVLNIAVVTNLIPTTGITLPFVSYGGTSILFLMTEMGVALSISRQITFR